MLFAEAFSGLQLILLGLSILVAAFVLRRALVLSRRSRNRDVQAEVRHEMRAAGQTGSSIIRELELRLHDYGREIEGRMQTRIAVLDQLVVDADREISRLRQLLTNSRQTDSTTAMKPGPDIVQPSVAGPDGGFLVGPHSAAATPLTAQQRHLVSHLAEAGYTTAEIAHLLERSQGEIQMVLDVEQQSNRADAA